MSAWAAFLLAAFLAELATAAAVVVVVVVVASWTAAAPWSMPGMHAPMLDTRWRVAFACACIAVALSAAFVKAGNGTHDDAPMKARYRVAAAFSNSAIWRTACSLSWALAADEAGVVLVDSQHAGDCRVELVVAVEAQDRERAVGVRDDERRLAAEPLLVDALGRRRRGGLAALDLDRAQHVVVPVDLAPLALDELYDEVGACAPQLVALHLQGAVVERGELVRDERRQVAARAGDRVEDRVRRGDVVDDGLRERD